MHELDPRLEPWVRRLRDGPRVRPEALAQARRAGQRARRVPSVPSNLLRAASVVAAVATGFAWFAWFALAGTEVPAPGTAEPQAERTALVPAHFVFHDPVARHVALVGDFNDWDPTATPLDRSDQGLWSVLVSVPTGSMRYAFLVDGVEWHADRYGAAAGSDFGRPTSIAFFPGSGGGE